VVAKLRGDLQGALKSAEVDNKIRAMGVEPMPMTPDEFKAYADEERATWADVIKKAGIKLE
jgi:tripartite-type tricarboxylate transporter receptor subunit TctC